MIINVTGHFLTFQDRHGQTFRVGPCGMVINATPAETLAFCQRDPECAAYSDYEHARADCACVEYVKVTYSVTDDTLGMLTYIEQKLRILCPVGHLTSLHHRYCDVCNRVVEYPDPLDRPVIVGSMIAAQAFPGRVVSPVLTPETARSEERRVGKECRSRGAEEQ